MFLLHVSFCDQAADSKLDFEGVTRVGPDAIMEKLMVGYVNEYLECVLLLFF